MRSQLVQPRVLRNHYGKLGRENIHNKLNTFDEEENRLGGVGWVFFPPAVLDLLQSIDL